MGILIGEDHGEFRDKADQYQRQAELMRDAPNREKLLALASRCYAVSKQLRQQTGSPV